LEERRKVVPEHHVVCFRASDGKAGPKLEVLAVNDLSDGHDYATPAISEGSIFI
jgi:hypothetical protein